VVAHDTHPSAASAEPFAGAVKTCAYPAESPGNLQSQKAKQWNVTCGFTSESRLQQHAVTIQGKEYFFPRMLRLLALC